MTVSEIYIILRNGDFKTVTTEIRKIDKAYRDGDPLMSDYEYDMLINTIKYVNPKNEIFISGQIQAVNSDRKEELKFPMYSLDKESAVELIQKWIALKNLPSTTVLIATAKYDGISILKDEELRLAWTKGDGVYGETMHSHYKKLNDNNTHPGLFTIGEMIIPKPIFASKQFYRENGMAYRNARNMMAGMKNNDKPSNDLKYVKHIRYGFATEDFTKNKSEQLDFISKNFSPIPYKVFRACDLKIEELNDLYIEWGKEYDIDGLVFDIEDKEIRKSLGRERNNNPAYARAYKNPEWSEKSITTILDIEWTISKQGYLKPVGLLEPIDVEGVTISRVTLNNASFVRSNCLSAGSQIVITRSGGVIPKLIEVLSATGFKMPKIKGSEIFWNDNGVELCVKDTDEQKIKKIISFFEILNTDNVSEGVVNQLYNAGYKTVKAILDLSKNDFEKLDKFGKRKAEIVYNSIKKAITNIELSKLMHASNLFVGLGSKKLELLMHFTEKPSFDEILKIEGFSDISAKAYLDNYDNFYNFIKDLPVIIKSKKEEPKNNNSNMKNDLTGMSVLFTGVRRQDLVDEIVSRGGKNLSAMSKNVTHLVCKDKNSTSSKMVEAKKNGTNIMSVEEMENYLKK